MTDSPVYDAIKRLDQRLKDIQYRTRGIRNEINIDPDHRRPSEELIEDVQDLRYLQMSLWEDIGIIESALIRIKPSLWEETDIIESALLRIKPQLMDTVSSREMLRKALED